MPAEPFHHWSIAALRDAFRTGRLSPVDVVTDCLERIAAFNPAVNAFCLVDDARALARAEASAQRWRAGTPIGPLDGIPCGVKDVTSTLDWASRRGSHLIPAGAPPATEAPFLGRLREAGAIFIGATNTAEFGWKGLTDNPLYGITRNPWNTALTPGGSSGGSAVAVALGLAALGTASDAAGSIRIPASFCGLFGLKPSYGIVPTSPLSSYGTISHQGVMARTVTDTAEVLDLICRPDPEGAPGVPLAGSPFAQALEGGVKGLRIAFSPNFGSIEVDPEIARAVAEAASRLRDLGATVEEIGEVLPSSTQPLIELLFRASVLHTLKRYGEEARGRIDPHLAAFAAALPAPTIDDYIEAAAQRVALGAHMQRFHARYDLLMTPTLPILPFTAGAIAPEGQKGGTWFDWAPFNYPFNLTMQPAASVPCGLSESGLPIGFQLVGPLYGDATVLRASRAYEKAFPPPALPDSPRQFC